MGLLVSRDGGRTWQPLALRGQVDFHAMTISADGGTLYGWNVMGSPGLYRVSAKDGTWKRLDAVGLRDVLSLAGHPTEPESLLAGTRSGLLVSRDGGNTWTSATRQLDGVSVTAAAYSPKDPRRLYAYAVRQDLGFLTSSDGSKRAGRAHAGRLGWVRAYAREALERIAPILSSAVRNGFKRVMKGHRW
jgi:hypothetical protein